MFMVFCSLHKVEIHLWFAADAFDDRSLKPAFVLVGGAHLMPAVARLEDFYCEAGFERGGRDVCGAGVVGSLEISLAHDDGGIGFGLEECACEEPDPEDEWDR